MRTPKRALVVSGLALALAPSALADVVWPAVYLQEGLTSWWAIGLGFVVEYVVLLTFFGLDRRRALRACFWMNTVSTVLGFVLIPLSGCSLVAFDELLVVSGEPTFSTRNWAATCVIAALVNTAVEIIVLRSRYGVRVSVARLCLLTAANAASVGLALLSLDLQQHGGTWSP